MHVAGTDPYPWPWDGRLDGDHLALVLAGWDEVWCQAALEPEPSMAACTELAAAVGRAGGLVLTVAHRGAVPLPVPDLGCTVASDGLDGFFDGPLDGTLRRAGRTHLLLAGLGLEGPVHSTLRSANDRGYECLLVADAAAPATADLAGAAVKTVTMSGGIFGAVGTAAATLDGLASLIPATIP